MFFASDNTFGIVEDVLHGGFLEFRLHRPLHSGEPAVKNCVNIGADRTPGTRVLVEVEELSVLYEPQSVEDVEERDLRGGLLKGYAACAARHVNKACRMEHGEDLAHDHRVDADARGKEVARDAPHPPEVPHAGEDVDSNREP